MEFKKQLVIKGIHYDLVDVQREGRTAIYRADESYLRIGASEKIKKDLAFHIKMESFGFPVAKLIDKGEFEGMAFFVEESLGEEKFGDIFKRETEQFGRIQDKTFDDFIAISEKFAFAQLKIATDKKDWNDFTRGIHLDIICDELPELKDRIMDTYKKAEERLSVFPFVITHGDFTSQNIYPKGVIDLEDSFMGPAGYDIGAIMDIATWFPQSKEYEFYRFYTFIDVQKQKYLDAMDAIYLKHNLPKISDYLADFNFTRGIWFAVRMDHTPKLQQFRYEALKKFFSSEIFMRC